MRWKSGGGVWSGARIVGAVDGNERVVWLIEAAIRPYDIIDSMARKTERLGQW